MSEATRNEQDAAPHDMTVVAGRYELLELAGRGGAGAVYAARDQATDERVAVKILDLGPASAPPRVRREVAALRHLHLPGVVALRDSGMHGNQPFLVMDFVDGRPFPGRDVPVRWEELAPLVRSLLEVLGRVHAAGIVHRDLKPSNVLVTAPGRVTLLDFGVSWGPALGEGVTDLGTIVGTPEYLAPEQFAGHRGDPRTDLYGLGVLLYEALTGSLPHEASDVMRLIDLKRKLAPMRVRARVPGVPRDVGQVVERLLSVDPGDRPQTVGELMSFLFGDDLLAPGTRELPWLGDTAVVQRIVDAARAGCPVDLHGPPGCGRSRALVAASERLEAGGADVKWIVPGASPYAGLRPLIGTLDDLAESAHAEALEAIDQRVTDVLAGGTIVIADDPERIDRWTRSVLDRCRTSGAVVRVVRRQTPDCEGIEPLREEDLRALFAGPERIFHLQTDGARELWRRTGGHQGRVAAEVSAWVRADLAHWEGELLSVSRDSLHRLRGGLPVSGELLLRHGSRATRSPELDLVLSWISLAWPNSSVEVVSRISGQPLWQVEPQITALAHDRLVHRLEDGRIQPLAVPYALQTWTADRLRDAHGAVADALAPGTPARYRHVVAAGDADEISTEALALAKRLSRDGRMGDALAVLEQGLASARASEDPDVEGRLLLELTLTCLDDGSLSVVQRGLYELSRATRPTESIAELELLLRTSRDIPRLDPIESIRVLDGMGPFDAPLLELWRHGQRFRAAMYDGSDAALGVLEDIEEWNSRLDDAQVSGTLASWRALWLQTVGRLRESAALHVEAAETSERSPSRLANLYNAALAFLEGGYLDDARSVAEQLLAESSARRIALFEANAAAMLRGIAYRSEETTETDAELAEATAGVGDEALEAQAFVTEAAIAWRAGRRDEARRLAKRSVEALRRIGVPNHHVHARALEIVCGAPVSREELSALTRDAEACADADISVQALGLLAQVDREDAARLHSIARERAEAIATADPLQRRDVISVAEAVGDVPLHVPVV